MWEGGHIQTEQLVNARDLGGMPAADGRTIRYGRLLRSGLLAQATESDLNKLVEEHALKTIVDLRGPEEISTSPDPVIAGVRYVDNPIMESRKLGITHEDDMFTTAKRISAGHEHMVNIYRKVMTDERALNHMKQAIHLALEQEEGAILYHCTAGKDRTGLVLAMLQMALGVPQDLIVEDYLFTNPCSKKAYDEIMAMVLIQTDDEETIESSRAMLLADQEYIDTALTTMILECGDYDTFLKERLGLDEETKARLREMYLE